MAESDAARADRKKTRSLARISGLAAFSFAAMLVYGGALLLTHPQTPLPPAWNPVQPLLVADPVTPITGWKLSRTASDAGLCTAALATAAEATRMPPLEETEACFIPDRVSLSNVGAASLAPVETSCATALHMAMWERHTVQPAAEALLGQPVRAIQHIGSYNCRLMRTTGGTSSRFSTHATASAMDVSGFGLADGSRISLLADWEGDGPKAAFLRRVRDGACDWFGLTLSPDYNRLHADHFHLQVPGWGGCR